MRSPGAVQLEADLEACASRRNQAEYPGSEGEGEAHGEEKLPD